MTITRRDFVKSTAAGLAGISTGIVSLPVLGKDADAIKLGVLLDMSGPLQAYGNSKARCILLAVEEINAQGGLLGRPLEIVQYDTQSQNQLYGQFAQQLALRDRVAVVHGGITSAAREVARPVLRRAKTLYFYNMAYEGGLCDRNTFVTGPTAQQLLSKLVPYVIEKFGRRIYIPAADYNFGHDSAAWIKKFAAESGGEVIGADFFPMDVNNFNSTVADIQKLDPDVVFSVLIGPSHGSFYGQWAAAGMNKKIPMASYSIGNSGDHKRMPAEMTDGIVTAKNYFEELGTPANKTFLDRFAKRFGADYGVMSSVAVADYQAVWMWAEAVKKAGSVEHDRVTSALESGIAVQGPSGQVAMDPATHHAVLDVYLAELKDRNFDVQQSWDAVPPLPGDQRCDLLTHPGTNKQFAPAI